MLIRCFRADTKILLKIGLIDKHAKRVAGSESSGWQLSKLQFSRFMCETVLLSSGRLIIDSAFDNVMRSLPTRDGHFLEEWKNFLRDITAEPLRIVETFALESTARPLIDQLFSVIESESGDFIDEYSIKENLRLSRSGTGTKEPGQLQLLDQQQKQLRRLIDTFAKLYSTSDEHLQDFSLNRALITVVKEISVTCIDAVESLLLSEHWIDLVVTGADDKRIRSLGPRTVSLTIAKYPWITPVDIPATLGGGDNETVEIQRSPSRGGAITATVPPLIVVLDEVRRIAASGMVDESSFISVDSFEKSVRTVLLALAEYIDPDTAIADDEVSTEKIVTFIVKGIDKVLERDLNIYGGTKSIYTTIDKKFGRRLWRGQDCMLNQYLSGVIDWVEKQEQEEREKIKKEQEKADETAQPAPAAAEEKTRQSTLRRSVGKKDKNASGTEEHHAGGTEEQRVLALFVAKLQDYGLQKGESLVKEFLSQDFDIWFNEGVAKMLESFQAEDNEQTILATKNMITQIYVAVFENENASGWDTLKHVLAGYLGELYNLCDIDGDRKVTSSEIALFKRLLRGLQHCYDSENGNSSLQLLFEMAREYEKSKNNPTDSNQVHSEDKEPDGAKVNFTSLAAIIQRLAGIGATAARLFVELLAELAIMLAAPIERRIKQMISTSGKEGKIGPTFIVNILNDLIQFVCHWGIEFGVNWLEANYFEKLGEMNFAVDVETTKTALRESLQLSLKDFDLRNSAFLTRIFSLLDWNGDETIDGDDLSRWLRFLSFLESGLVFDPDHLESPSEPLEYYKWAASHFAALRTDILQLTSRLFDADFDSVQNAGEKILAFIEAFLEFGMSTIGVGVLE
eukprot:SAG31_NODE_1224_length_9286_cov_11.643953_4_plen_853_part_00